MHTTYVSPTSPFSLLPFYYEEHRYSSLIYYMWCRSRLSLLPWCYSILNHLPKSGWLLSWAFLAHLTQRVMWGIVITWSLLSCFVGSINFYILFFFSETTRPIATKLSRNVHWMVPYKVCFLLIRSTQKKQEDQRYQKGYVLIYGYKLFIVHLFLMRFFFLKKPPFRNMYNIIM